MSIDEKIRCPISRAILIKTLGYNCVLAIDEEINKEEYHLEKIIPVIDDVIQRSDIYNQLHYMFQRIRMYLVIESGDNSELSELLDRFQMNLNDLESNSSNISCLISLSEFLMQIQRFVIEKYHTNEAFFIPIIKHVSFSINSIVMMLYSCDFLIQLKEYRINTHKVKKSLIEGLF